MNLYKRMNLVCRAIPPGHVASYGQIALLCGMPGHARQVGTALSRRLVAEDLPAHRMVNSRGVLSGAAAFDPPGTQQCLLLQEGVALMASDRVDMARYCWRTTLQNALAFLALFKQMDI